MRNGAMCFSPEADIVAGLLIAAVGVDALRHVDHRRDLAIASVPLVLAAHQLIEAVAWWGLDGRTQDPATRVAITTYLVIALGVIPILIPWAVMRTEQDPTRRAMMKPFVLLGIGVAVVLVTSLIASPYGATIADLYIDYEVDVIGGGITAGAYALPVCVPLLMSSSRRLVIFGVLNVLAASVLSALLVMGVISLWCVWSAASSVVIAWYLRGPSVARPPFWLKENAIG
ncbi:MAG TPA: DUF6629 family protein [Acidimicrobiia bacterium]|nr:DUF6629 family protein [Acidimicrobiia bacterium]